MVSCLDKKSLISNILCEESDSEEEVVERFVKTKRNILLSQEEVRLINRRISAPPSHQAPRQEVQETSVLRLNAPEFVPPSQSCLAEYSGRIVVMAQDQIGSRFLQEKLEAATPADIALVLEEICRSSVDLSTDIFGNYVIQKLLTYKPPQLIQRLKGSVLQLSLHMYGCRVIQAAIENADYSDKLELLSELRKNIDSCINNANASHVVQKAICKLNWPDIQFIIEACEQKCYQITVDQHGCMVIQRLLENSPRSAIAQIVSALIDRAVDASVSPYGNYVIQYLLKKGSVFDRDAIINNFSGQLAALSKQKFSSNVIEKCMECATNVQVKAIAMELFSSPDLLSLLTDRFSNFVIQKTLLAADLKTRSILVSKIYEYEANLKAYPHGRHVLNCIKKMKRPKSNLASGI